MIHFEQAFQNPSRRLEALKKVRNQNNKGEMIFIDGHSGSGKSTVLKLISGITKPSEGAQNPVQRAGSRHTVRQTKIGFMRQTSASCSKTTKSSTTVQRQCRKRHPAAWTIDYPTRAKPKSSAPTSPSKKSA